MLDCARVLVPVSSPSPPALADGFRPDIDQNDPKNVPYYSESIARRFFSSLPDGISRRFERIQGCGKIWVKQTVLLTENENFKIGDLVMKRVSCKTVFCPDCGRKGGVKHVERKLRVYEHLKRIGDIENLTLGQFIWTLPESQREFFMSREKILGFRRLCVESIRTFLPGRLPIVFVHLVGDRDLLYKPHVNIFTVHKRGEWISIAPDKLVAMKKFIYDGLISMGCEFLSSDNVNMQYKMKLTSSAVGHAVKYMTRPVPSYDFVMKLLRSSDESSLSLLNFIAVDMDGFAYLNYPRREWDVLRGSAVSCGLIPGVVLSRGERVSMSWFRFIDTYRNYERSEIFPGVYHIHGGRLSTGGDYVRSGN